jgi:hypothetical protein
MRQIIAIIAATAIVCTAVFIALPSANSEPQTTRQTRPTTTTTTTTTTTVPEVHVHTVTDTIQIETENPQTIRHLEACAQAFHDLQPVFRTQFDAMRAYQSGFEDQGRELENQAELLYGTQYRIYLEACDTYVTNRQPNPWG